MSTDTLLTLWRSIQEGYLVPLLVVIAAGIFYLVANSLFSTLIARIRSSIRETGIPYELVIGPLRLLVLLIGLAVLLHSLSIGADIREILRHTLLIAAVFAISWLMIRLFVVFEQFILQHYASQRKESESARKIATHVSLARKILNVLVVLLSVAGVLMTFDTVRQVGLSILASAGIAGVMLGFAAQKSLATLVAGIQIAITQPISIDDVVVVENEGGRIEEISLTYVVVQLWDQRRLIVPITWFIDKPFQNWTRTSAELLGTVSIFTHYSIPPEALRGELMRILASTPLWDKRVGKLQVVNTTETAIEMRALVSASNSSNLGDLRFYVREKLIGFLRENYPELAPKVTLEAAAVAAKQILPADES
ncbi:MAG: mechanosensitive ion channel domain-containing protein [Chlorobiaceae bacterium]